MLPITASSTTGVRLLSAAPCCVAIFCANASASCRERTAAICTLNFPPEVALGAGCKAACWTGLAFFFDEPVATDVVSLQLDVATDGVVDAVVTGALIDAGAPDPPPENKFLKKQGLMHMVLNPRKIFTISALAIKTRKPARLMTKLFQTMAIVKRFSQPLSQPRLNFDFMRARKPGLQESWQESLQLPHEWAA